MVVDAFPLTRQGTLHRFSLQRTVAELLSKRWMDAMAPVALLIGVIIYFSVTTQGFLGSANMISLTQILAEYGLLALALTVVLVGGGIDLSVGAVFGVSNGVCVILYKLYGWPVPLVVLVGILVGLACGSVNGVIISYFRTRPFITTLVTLLLFRTIALYLDLTYTTRVSAVNREDAIWTALSQARLSGLPIAFWIFVVAVLVLQVVLTRSRFGWQLMAVGSSRTAARRSGMSLGRVGFQSYLLSGALAGLAGTLVAARLEQTSQTTGQGLEFVALTAVIIGGVSLAGGKGTATRAFIGTLVVTCVYQGLITQGYDINAYYVVLSIVLMLFATLDIKYAKNRDRAIQKIFIAPAELDLKDLPDITEPGSVWNVNRRLTGAQSIGRGMVEGPEDVILDTEGRMYCGDRRGWVWRFSGTNYEHGGVFSRVGGFPLGMAFDATGNLLICVGGMGLYSIAPDGTSKPLATQTKRSWYRIRDDSSIRLADDLDVVPDGRVFFSDASTRFDGIEYMFDVTEARPNGRVLCYDPSTGKTTTVVKNMPFPNGVCTAHDGESILVASTITCSVWRYWVSGRKKGDFEPFLTNLPGFPDNINRASNGTYWMAFAGMRTPSFDLSLRDAGWRRRMLKQIPQDEWLMFNMNTSCVFRFDEDGNILESYWDQSQEDHSVITSMREYDGHLFLGGLHNDRVGRIRLDDSPVTAQQWGRQKATTGASRG